MSNLEGNSWTLYYWNLSPPLRGRGEYIRLMFEAARIPFTEIGDPKLLSPLVDRMARYGEGGNAPEPVFAVPLVIGPDGVCLSQTNAIMAYLGKKFGFYPSNDYDEAKAMQIVLSVADFHSEGRASFHPVDLAASYYTQVEEAKIASAKFASGRFVSWLNHFERLLAANTKQSGYFVGDKMTYADIAVFHVMNAAASQFPEAWAIAEIPGIKSFQDRMLQFPPLAEYFQSDRLRPFEGNSMM